MRSNTSLCNLALALINGRRITGLSENSAEAKQMSLLFQETLDSILTEHDFNEAMYSAELALLSETPAFKYTYKHQLPVNPYCLRIIKVFDSNEEEILDYTVEGRTINSDESQLYISYVARIDDYNIMSSSLVEAFVNLLASKAAKPLTGSDGLANSLYDKYRIALKKAINKDAAEERRDDYTDENFPWLNCRR